MNKLIESLTYCFVQNMNGTDRGLRLTAGLSEPLLSLTGVINGPLENAFCRHDHGGIRLFRQMFHLPSDRKTLTDHSTQKNFAIQRNIHK